MRWPWLKKSIPKLVWIAQFVRSEPGDKLLHFAKCNLGFYEIYADYESLEFLVSYPRACGLPADLFGDLGSAKERCDAVHSKHCIT
jgi:hypothetical protein